MTKKTIWWVLGIIFIPICLLLGSLILVYNNQGSVTQKAIAKINEQFIGELTIENSRVSIWKNFPYVSIDLQGIRFYESKSMDTPPLYEAADFYLGFDFWSIWKGDYTVRKLVIQNGRLDIIQYPNGDINLLLAKGLTDTEQDTTTSSFSFALDEFVLEGFELAYANLSDSTEVLMHISSSKASFAYSDDHIFVDLLTDMILDVDQKGEHTFFADKIVGLDISLDYFQSNSDLVLSPSILKLQDAIFDVSGKMNLAGDMEVDLRIDGDKPDFSLIASLLPNDVGQQLNSYENRGQVFFTGSVKGKMANDNLPEITFEFGCDNAYFLNTSIDKKIDNLRFSGFYTNGSERNLKTSEFQLLNFNAKPDQGNVQGRLIIRNFENPYVLLNVNADLDLGFLGDFFEIEGLQGLSGQVVLDMDFDELVDLEMTSSQLVRTKENLKSELFVRNLQFSLPDYPHVVRNANGYAVMREGNIRLDSMRFEIADSDFFLDGEFLNFPEFIHAQDIPVEAKFRARSKKIDVGQLANTIDSAFQEVIEDMRMELRFVSKGSELWNFKHLPKGEFFIDDLYAKLNNYPHVLHDFHADIVISEDALDLIDFKGEIDKSDFLFTGRVENYTKWFQDIPRGVSEFDFDLTSRHINFSDLLSYNGVNYLPEDYQKEEIDNFKLKGSLSLNYDSTFQSADFSLGDLRGKFSKHPLRLEGFSGRAHYERDFLTLTDFGGKMGRSDFRISMGYFMGEGRPRMKNSFVLQAMALDLDTLLGFEGVEQDTNHQEAFNIFELPFSDMDFRATIGKLNYHTFWLENFQMAGRTTMDHYIHLDTLGVEAADGKLGIKGYFNGSDPENIYFSSTMKVEKLDLDKLLIKFENFGQDYLINENLHGKVSGTITSNFKVYPDLTPIIDKSEALMDLRVYQGSLVNFGPLDAMASFFKDKNLSNVRFDTLQNTFELKEGVLNIPKMNINSSLGFIELSGRQSLDLNMDYFIRIPLGLVTQVGFRSLFGGKSQGEVDPDQEDAIVYRDEDRRVRFVNVNMKGTPDDYQITLGRDRN